MSNIFTNTTMSNTWINRPIPLIIKNCELWLDSADEATISLSGSKVSQWNDKSGEGNNFIQATESLQPEYLYNEVNGLNACYFYDSDMGGGDILAPTNVNEFTMLLVMVLDATTPDSGRFIRKRGATTYYDCYKVSTNKVRIYDGTAVRGTSNSPWSTSQANIFTYALNSASSKIFVNQILGANIPYAATGTGAIDTTLGVGGSRIKFCEVLFYNRALLTEEIETIESYLNTKWNTV